MISLSFIVLFPSLHQIVKAVEQGLIALGLLRRHHHRGRQNPLRRGDPLHASSVRHLPVHGEGHPLRLRSEKERTTVPSGTVVLLSALGGVLLPHLLDALGLGLLGGIPAAALHGGIDLLLHADGVIEGGAEGVVHLGRGGFDGAVQIQVTDSLGGQEDALHDLLVVHRVIPFLTPDCKSG